MKNKHLVLLFMLVLLSGLVLRRVPWFCRAPLQAPLLRVSAEAVYRLRVLWPGRSEWSLERTAMGWMVEQDGRTVPISSDAARGFVLLFTQGIRLESVPVKVFEDAVAEAPLVQVLVEAHGTTPLALDIGPEIPGPTGAQTLIRFRSHAGHYRAYTALRSPLNRTLDSFRSRQLLAFVPDEVWQITFVWPPDSTTIFERRDSVVWQTPSEHGAELPFHPVQYWLNAVAQLKDLPFADFFDESREEEWLQLTATLTAKSGQAVVLRFFAWHPPELPEDVGPLLKQGLRTPPRYVVHSSANPRHYFALPDAEMGERLSNGP